MWKKPDPVTVRLIIVPHDYILLFSALISKINAFHAKGSFFVLTMPGSPALHCSLLASELRHSQHAIYLFSFTTAYTNESGSGCSELIDFSPERARPWVTGIIFSPYTLVGFACR